MKIYDISQEVFSCEVYPGDPEPHRRVVASMAEGSLYNLTALDMGAHNGTHVDAPRHFYADGTPVDQLDLSACVGRAYVALCSGALTAEDALHIVQRARLCDGCAAARILLKGDGIVTEEAAHTFAELGVRLLGVEGTTVGPKEGPMAVHLILLGRQVVLLEGLRMQAVPEGAYFLSAAPLKLAGADGAPCRALLVEL